MSEIAPICMAQSFDSFSCFVQISVLRMNNSGFTVWGSGPNSRFDITQPPIMHRLLSKREKHKTGQEKVLPDFLVSIHRYSQFLSQASASSLLMPISSWRLFSRGCHQRGANHGHPLHHRHL